MKFKYDNKLFGIIGKIADCFFAGILWIISCIPIVTIGVASTALYYTVHKVIFSEEGYVFSTYKKAFKENFKTVMLKWLPCLLLDIFLLLDLIIMKNALKQGSVLGGLYYFFIVISMVAFAWQVVLFSYAARFEDSYKNSMIKSFVLAIGNIGWMLLIELVLYIATLICNQFQSLFLILPGLFCCFVYYIVEKIFRKLISKDSAPSE